MLWTKPCSFVITIGLDFHHQLKGAVLDAVDEEEMIQNAIKGLRLPSVNEEIVALFDISVFGNCKKGLIFTESGFYASRMVM